jgi:hypothetical protein
MDHLFNQEKTFYNSTLADLEISYHLLTSIYYKNSLNLTMSLVTKYYPYQPQKLVNAELCKLLFLNLFITECCSFNFLNHERKLFSVIRMSKEPSQLHNMVKQRCSSRRGYNPYWIRDRPFNMNGEGMVFCFIQNLFFGQHKS